MTGEECDKISKNKFPSLLKLLLQFRERIEYELSDIRGSIYEGGTVHHGEGRLKGRNIDKPVESKKQKCWIHLSNGDHPIWRCRVFENKSPSEKVDLVKKNNACFACLETGHVAKNCKRNFRCKHDSCGLEHHQLLHEAHASGMVFHSSSAREKPAKADSTILQLQKIKGGNNFSQWKDLNVLWDCGSTLSFITFKQAKKLRLNGKRVRLQIVKVGGETRELDSYHYQLYFQDKGNKTVEVEVLGIDSISTDICEVKVDDIPALFDCISMSDLDRPNEGQIDCLIGYQYAGFHPVRKQAAGHLLILENQFGYVVGGSHPKLKENTRKLVQHVTVNHAQVRIEDFYTMENLRVECKPKCGSCKCGRCHPGGKDMSLKDEREYKLIEDYLVYLPEKKKWIAGYPWIRDPTELPDNRPAALAKLKTMERRLLSNPDHAALYNCQIEDMVERGVARKLQLIEMLSYRGPVHYISHHAVMKPESKSTPCRIVFNSSANYHGHILNEYYAKEPDMLNNLLRVLLRFREE